MKVLLDTNVIIDVLTSREPWCHSAERIFIMAANNIVDACVTASSATDIYYLIKKHLHSSEDAKNIMSKLFSLVEILNVSKEDCVDALVSPITDYEDAVIEQVSRRSGIEYIVTRNEKDIEMGNTRVVTPEKFVKLIEQVE